jgi:hypothetical protein
LIKLADLIIRKQPRLKSFINQSKCVALVALKALLQLVAHDKSGHSTSSSKEFDLQLEEDGVAKSLVMYKELRFTRLEYSSGAVLECLPQYQKILDLDNTSCSNLLIESCMLYVANDYVVAAFKALSYLTYKVTMPYLNFVEKSDQNALLPMLKLL